MLGLLVAGRMLGQAASSGPKKPPPDPKTTAIAWAVVGTIVLSFWWWQVWIVAGVVLLLCALASWDRKATARSAPDPLEAAMHELLAKYDDNGRRK